MKTWFWVFGWFLSILTITGNGFIIFLVCKKRQLRTKTNTFVVSLAVADLFVGITVFPVLFSLEMTRDRSYSQELYKGMLIVRWLFQDTSVVNLCSLVLERYFAIVMPFKYVTFMTRQRVVQLIFIPWTLTIIFILLEASLWIGLNSFFILKIFIWPAIIFFLFLPSCMVSFCLISMLCIVYKHNRTSRILTRQLRFNHRISHKPYEKSPTVMMVIVSSFFLVHSVVNIRCAFLRILTQAEDCYDLDYKIPLLVLNSAVNPLAYAVFKRDMKKELKRQICTVILKNEHRRKTFHFNRTNRITASSTNL